MLQRRRISQSNSSNVFTPHSLISPDKLRQSSAQQAQDIIIVTNDKELGEVPEVFLNEGSVSDYNVENMNPAHSDIEDEFEESELLMAEDLGYDEEEGEECCGADYEDI